VPRLRLVPCARQATSNQKADLLTAES